MPRLFLRPSIALVLLLLILATGCSSAPDPEDDPEVVQRGSRLLGVSISDRADNDFNAAFNEAVDAGMQLTSLSLSWDDLESSPGVYNPNPDFLAIANSFYGAAGTRMIVGINPIDTNNKRVPGYLAGLAWDDQRVIDAYQALLDWALPRISAVDLLALSIGNEIDAWLSSPAEWDAYAVFLDSVATYARAVSPGLQIGSKITSGGIAGQPAMAALVNGKTDKVLTTYYPLNSDFTIKAASTVRGVFDDLVARFPGRTIIFAEIGSPSTSQCGSSPDNQADFIREAFAAWDAHASQVEALEFTWMHDISSAALETYEQYYGLSDVCFLEYLATLGLKSPTGADKPAWLALEAEAEKRGW